MRKDKTNPRNARPAPAEVARPAPNAQKPAAQVDELFTERTQAEALAMMGIFDEDGIGIQLPVQHLALNSGAKGRLSEGVELGAEDLGVRLPKVTQANPSYPWREKQGDSLKKYEPRGKPPDGFETFRLLDAAAWRPAHRAFVGLRLEPADSLDTVLPVAPPTSLLAINWNAQLANDWTLQSIIHRLAQNSSEIYVDEFFRHLCNLFEIGSILPGGRWGVDIIPQYDIPLQYGRETATARLDFIAELLPADHAANVSRQIAFVVENKSPAGDTNYLFGQLIAQAIAASRENQQRRPHSVFKHHVLFVSLYNSCLRLFLVYVPPSTSERFWAGDQPNEATIMWIFGHRRGAADGDSVCKQEGSAGMG